MKNVLVTGGAGYIGSHTVKELIAKGYNVIVYDNISTGHKELIPNGAIFVKGDLNDETFLDETFKKYNIELVIHFAANAYVGESVINPQKYYLNNVLNGIKLLNTMLANDVKSIVFSSSCATYGIPSIIPIREEEVQNPINPYGRTKLMMENIMKDYDNAYGLKYVSLRYFNAAGADADLVTGEWHEPETHVIPLLLDVALGKQSQFKVFGDDYNTPDGTCVRDYIHVTDLADAHIKAMQYLINGNDSLCVNLGTGKGISIKELIKSVEKITGENIPYIIEERRPGDPDMLVAENYKAKKVIGWEPMHSDIDNIIFTAWNWHKKRG